MAFNEPFYFYSIIYNPYSRKKLEIETRNIGLMTPKYMLDHNKTDLLDDVLAPWRRVIVNIWGMYQEDPGHLTRQEVIDALNIKLGPEFMKSIYLHKFVPSTTLGWQLKLVLSDSAFFRLDMNRIDLINYIGQYNIDWGRDIHIANRKLDKLYWQKVTYDEYVSMYRDGLNVEHKARLLNQFNKIRIEPSTGIIPNKFIEDMTSKLSINIAQVERSGVY